MGLFKKKNVPSSTPVATPTMQVSDYVLPIEERVTGIQPTCDSYYSHEILVLSYAEHYMTQEKEYPDFWWYKYGIKDIRPILNKLQSNGLIGFGSIEDTLNRQKIPDLKTSLQKHSLAMTGKKADMIKRILENISVDELNQEFPVKPYKLTEQGQRLLQKYNWINYIHNHNITGLDIWNLTQIVQTPPYTPYRDKIWGYLNQRGSVYAKAGDWGLYRNSRFEMSEFVMEENKPDIAFALLCETVAYDLSGVNNGFRPEHMAQQYDFFYPYEQSIVKMGPSITARIKELSDNFEWTDAQLYAELKKGFEKYTVQFSIFSAEEKARIVLAEINKDSQTLTRIYEESQKRFKKQYRIK